MVFESRCQLPTCLPHGGDFKLSLIVLNVKQRTVNMNFKVFGLTRPRIEPESTVPEADALSTRALIGIETEGGTFFSFLTRTDSDSQI